MSGILYFSDFCAEADVWQCSQCGEWCADEDIETIAALLGTDLSGALLGDMDQDGDLDLADVILAIQICTGKAPSLEVTGAADVNGDSRIGLEEAIYVLRKAAQ